MTVDNCIFQSKQRFMIILSESEMLELQNILSYMIYKKDSNITKSHLYKIKKSLYESVRS